MNMEDDSQGLFTCKYAHPMHAISIAPSDSFRFAACSFSDDRQTKNHLYVTDLAQGQFRNSCVVEQPFPSVQVSWCPNGSPVLATASDYVRIYSERASDARNGGELVLEDCYGDVKDFCCPLTSFDWSFDGATLVAVGVDGYCTLWDLARRSRMRRFMPNGGLEVYDTSFFAPDPSKFATCGDDGRVVIHDQRSESGQVVYAAQNDSPNSVSTIPILKIDWNSRVEHHIAAVRRDGTIVVIDTRSTSLPVLRLKQNSDRPVGSIKWAPTSPQYLCSAEDAGVNSKVLIWSTTDGEEGADTHLNHRFVEGATTEPIYEYQSAYGGVSEVSWSWARPDWIGVSTGNHVQLLRV